MKYRTYTIEQGSPGFWHVMDPTKQFGYECLGVFETKREAKQFVDELMATIGRAMADAMRGMRERAKS